MKCLKQLRAGECARIENIDAPAEVRERLKMLNVFPGAEIRLIKSVFFGSTFLLEASGVRVGVRGGLAEKIFVRAEGVATEGKGGERP